ncbi:hypothetical protein EDB89DRAFT_2031272 [Lactarius sanguifluus]|nr:hypothetical protein EDB89DRAFT_2031272 [Lactarius sanguifluus]
MTSSVSLPCHLGIVFGKRVSRASSSPSAARIPRAPSANSNSVSILPLLPLALSPSSSSSVSTRRCDGATALERESTHFQLFQSRRPTCSDCPSRMISDCHQLASCQSFPSHLVSTHFSSHHLISPFVAPVKMPNNPDTGSHHRSTTPFQSTPCPRRR